MISIHCATMTKAALQLKATLAEHGIESWVCVQMTGGTDYREAIVDAVKSCKVFLPLLNNEWALSGECEDEYSLAKRLNLTSHECGRTDREQPRQPILLPVAFSNLNWTAHKHVELLAAKTNFIVHDAKTLEEGNTTQTINTLLMSLARFGFEVKNPPAVLLAVTALKKKGTKETQKSVQEEIAQVHSSLESLTATVQHLMLKMNQPGALPQEAAAQGAEKDVQLGKEYLGVIATSNPSYAYWDSTEFTLSYDVANMTDSVPVKGTMIQKELRKLVSGKPLSQLSESDPLYGWASNLSVIQGELHGTYERSVNMLQLKTKGLTMEKNIWLNVLPGLLSGMGQVVVPHTDKPMDPLCTHAISMKQIR